MDELKADIQEMRQDLKELIKQGVEHNVLLKQHEARSLALQKAQEHLDARILPVEDHVKFLNKLGKGVTAFLLTVVIGVLAKVLTELI